MRRETTQTEMENKKLRSDTDDVGVGQKAGGCSVKYKRPVFIVMLLILVVTIVCLDAHIYGKIHELQSQYSARPLQNASVHCYDLSMSPYDDAETFDRQRIDFKLSVSDTYQYVCTYLMKDLTWLVNKWVDRQTRLRISKGLHGPYYSSCGNENLAQTSGYLSTTFSGISLQHNFAGTANGTILHWNQHHVMSYMHPDLSYNNGELTITQGRIYYVYASVHFRIQEGHERKRYKFSLRICRKMNHDYEDILLVKKNEFDGMAGDVSSLSIGGHLVLDKDDKIYVKVSDAGAVIAESRGNVFGIFPMQK